MPSRLSRVLGRRLPNQRDGKRFLTSPRCARFAEFTALMRPPSSPSSCDDRRAMDLTERYRCPKCTGPNTSLRLVERADPDGTFPAMWLVPPQLTGWYL